jgi:mono/diheme cytochrome c family protein
MAACGDPAFTGPETLGGVPVPAATLNRGHRVYERNCLVCHGERGDGRGPAARTMSPPPRDFRQATFKYAGIEDRGLPDDDELIRIVRSGLTGSAMPPWDLSEPELRAVVSYVKTFSFSGTGFRDARLEVKKPVIPPDPFAGETSAGIERGRKLFHSYFECAKCHPSYVPPSAFQEWEAEQRADGAYLPAPKWSAGHGEVLVPPDFLRHDMRSVRRGADGASAEDLYRITAYGLQGPMPGYGHLGAADVWAVAHYVKSLADSRWTEAGRQLARDMANWER